MIAKAVNFLATVWASILGPSGNCDPGPEVINHNLRESGGKATFACRVCGALSEHVLADGEWLIRIPRQFRCDECGMSHTIFAVSGVNSPIQVQHWSAAELDSRDKRDG